MEKIIKFSKGIDKFLKVVGNILVTCAIVAEALFGVVLFVSGAEKEMTFGTWSLEFGTLELKLSDGVLSSPEMLRAQCVSTMLLCAVIVIVVYIGIRLLRRILAPMTQGKPFAESVSKDMKKLGWLVMIGSVAMGIAQAIGGSLIFAAFHVGELLISDRIVEVSTNYQILDVKVIVLGLLLFLLSHVFRYGELLQQQDDETL